MQSSVDDSSHNREKLDASDAWSRHTNSLRKDIKDLEEFSHKSLSEIRLKTFAAITAAVAKSIIEIFGDKAAVGIMSRGCYPIGLRAGKRINRFFGLAGGGISSVSRNMEIVAYINNVTYKILEKYDNFYRSRNYSCPYAVAFSAYGPSMARLICKICEQYCQGAMDAASEGYKCKMKKTLAAGDPYCEFIIFKDGIKENSTEKGAPLKKYELPFSLKLVPENVKMNISIETIESFFVSAIVAMAAVANLKSVIGITSRACCPVGVDSGKRKIEYCGIHENSIETTIRLLELSFATLRMKSTVEEKSRVHAKVKVKSCSLGNMIRKTVDETDMPKNIKRDVKFNICELCRQYHLGVIHSISQDYDLEIPYRISVGDRYCEFMISRTSG